ncbi:hypothetical protein KBB96_04150 [Luteolibacter ambystomatis]|uniref:Uncharacterized protein n=1 Tax=Luteolibacter ambystomatis TaxID=2824561 RepID=A0A975J133_9BACT|nr:hypothetical protein [Luteolibacter ambystomatis]QUE52086.1 hypothetical protein KBB96_04150 [Luteolibacter ambystomatis]
MEPLAASAPVSARSRPTSTGASLEDRFANLMKAGGSAAALAAAKALTGKECENAISFLFSYGTNKDPEFVARELADSGFPTVC